MAARKLTRKDLADDVNFSYLSYTQRVEGLGGIGASFGYLSYGKSEGTDIDGNPRAPYTAQEVHRRRVAGLAVPEQ